MFTDLVDHVNAANLLDDIHGQLGMQQVPRPSSDWPTCILFCFVYASDDWRRCSAAVTIRAAWIVVLITSISG